MSEDEVIRTRIKNECASKGLSRYQLAEDSGISYAALCRFLSGKTNVTLYMVKKIGAALDIPYNEILLGSFNDDAFTLEEKQMVFAWRNMNTGVKNAIYLLMNQYGATGRMIYENEKRG